MCGIYSLKEKEILIVDFFWIMIGKFCNVLKYFVLNMEFGFKRIYIELFCFVYLCDIMCFNLICFEKKMCVDNDMFYSIFVFLKCFFKLYNCV